MHSNLLTCLIHTADGLAAVIWNIDLLEPRSDALSFESDPVKSTKGQISLRKKTHIKPTTSIQDKVVLLTIRPVVVYTDHQLSKVIRTNLDEHKE
jgi:hypothetical protein